MVDRKSRTQLVGVINAYLDEKVTAFEFDEYIREIALETDDETVDFVVEVLWSYYDDCKDHLVVLTKQQWDFFQRLILLLEADVDIQVGSQRIWSMRQSIAFAACVLLLVSLGWLGFTYRLFLVTIPLGFVSVGLSQYRRTHSPHQPQDKELLIPFSSITELLAVRRSVWYFRKRRYPSKLADRRFRSTFMDTMLALQTYAVWLILSPLVLMCQALPEKHYRVNVNLSYVN